MSWVRVCEFDPQNKVPGVEDIGMDHPYFLPRTEPWTPADPWAWCPCEAPVGGPSLCPGAPDAALLPPAGGGGSEQELPSCRSPHSPCHLRSGVDLGVLPPTGSCPPAQPSPAQKVTYTVQEGGQVRFLYSSQG